MKPALLALAIASVLLSASLAGIGVSLSVAPGGIATTWSPGADEDRIAHGHAGDHAYEALGMERPRFPEAVGTTPTSADAAGLEEMRRIVVRSDGDFTPAAGIRSGTGTLEDPYIISGYYVVGDLYIEDTDACFIVRENYIGGQLTLNWNGQCAWVHHNFIRDLRVNENNQRTGYATGGLLESNKIEYIGQLRHYDGEFRNNLVGPKTTKSMWDPIMETVPWMFGDDPRVANIDGFNQGLIHHNTFHGSVDLDFHGHHHGTGFFAPHSHYHGSDMERATADKGHEHGDHDHTQRWTSVSFADNHVIDPEGYGLRYEDRNHAGDDRTARSEDNEDLRLDHVHYTHIEIARNSIEDGQLWVDVFNADDRLHTERNPGTLELVGNSVVLQERREEGTLGIPFFGHYHEWDSALSVVVAKELDLIIRGNTLRFVADTSSDDGTDLWPFDDGEKLQPTAIRIERIKDASVVIEENRMEDFHYGIRARDMDAQTEWTVSGNDFGNTQKAVYYDESVENRPIGSDV